MGRKPVLVIVWCLAFGSAAHAVTKAQWSIVPVPARCEGNACNNGAGTCDVDAECNVGSLSLTSRFRADGTLTLKGTIKSVKDAAGDPVTTDGRLGTADDYIFKLCLRGFIPSAVDACLYVHVELAGGQGRIALVATPFREFFPPDSSVELTGAEFLASPSDPSHCPGDNDTSDATRFLANQVGLPTKPACEDGGTIGVGGVVNGA